MSDLADILMNQSFWVAVLRIATPLILGTLGVLLCERAGVLNLGIEGIMVAGAFTGWLAVYAMGKGEQPHDPDGDQNQQKGKASHGGLYPRSLKRRSADSLAATAAISAAIRGAGSTATRSSRRRSGGTGSPAGFTSARKKK